MLRNDLVEVEVINECVNVNVVADSMLVTLFYNFIDNSVEHGEKVSKITLRCLNSNDSLRIVYEIDAIVMF